MQRLSKHHDESESQGRAIGLVAYLITTIIWIAVVSSALGVIYTTHVTRQLFYELQSLNKQGDELEVEWGQLLLEQSTQASQVRVERLATKKLGMLAPSIASVVIVK